MSRLIFEARRRLAPPSSHQGTIIIEAPPELPRVIHRHCYDERCLI